MIDFPATAEINFSGAGLHKPALKAIKPFINGAMLLVIANVCNTNSERDAWVNYTNADAFDASEHAKKCRLGLS